MDFNLDKAILSSIYYFTSDGIFILDKEWRIVSLNRAAEAISGWDKSDVTSTRLCTELFICYDKDGNQLCEEGCPKQSVMETKKPLNSLDVKIMTRSGQPVFLPGLSVFIPGEGGASYAAIIIRDEIEKQLMEERLLSCERLDPLTQLYHRQYFEDLYNIEAKRLQRHGGIVALLMLDVAQLRDINGKLGHKKGDEVLRAVGKIIKKTIREVDIASRYGDDEFIILLYGVDEIKAQSFIQRLRENVAKWNQVEKFPSQVRLNMCLMVEDRDFDSLLGRIKGIIDEHKGIPL